MKTKKPAPAVRPSRVVAYVRVSLEKQADQGHSLDAQQAYLTDYARVMGLEIVAFEVDAGASAKTLERPALQRALARLDAFEAEALLVVKLDRLTRSVKDLCTLVDTYFKDGVYSLLSVGESIDTRSAAGRMMLNMLTVIGQWEREAIGERTSAAMQHMKTEGRFTGGTPPFGFQIVEGKLFADNVEQRYIAKAKELSARGHSLRQIARDLGVSPRNGRLFDATQVKRMIEDTRALEGV